MVFGCLIQCAYAMLIFESKSVKKIVLVLTFTFMACLSEILTYFMFKIIYGADFSSVDLANRYDLLPVTILNTINYLFVQVVLALKNRYKTEIKNIVLIFLSACNIFMLALMLLTTAQGEMGRIPSTFAVYMILFFSLIMVE